ncbi:hypothetical protein [Gracilimonas sp.]|uniref:hypothetical protein n=1 Tax=Gracilimonas sp. TaxID=1974203 RepID=UPI0028712CD7|nr:hypothetical protein [Gracilimonas sp.]
MEFNEGTKEKLLEWYKNEIEDFKKTKYSGISNGQLRGYVQIYNVEISTVKSFDEEQKNLIYSKIEKAIMEIANDKKILFNNSGEMNFHVEKWLFESSIKESFYEKGLSQLSEEVLIHLSESVFVADPWNNKPEDDTEFERRRLWWLGVELNRHAILFDKAYRKEIIGEMTLYSKTNEVKPKDKWEWIEQEYENNRENFKNDSEWAIQTLKKFKDKFKTSKGSAISMKRFGKYKGRH